MKNILAFVILTAGLTACSKLDFSGMFAGSSPAVDKRFPVYLEYNRTHPIDDITASVDNYSFYFLTDIHCESDATRVSGFATACLAGTDVEHFVLFGGDLVRGRDNYEYPISAFKPLYDAGWQIFSTIGNHDIYFGDWEKYTKFFPSSTYTFKVVTPGGYKDLFICVDSADGTIGTQQRVWLEDVLANAASGNFRHIILFTHTHFFDKDNTQIPSCNYAMEETADLLALFAEYGVDYVITGHDHDYEFAKFRNVEYYTLNAFDVDCDHSSYYIFTIGQDGLTHREFRI